LTNFKNDKFYFSQHVPIAIGDDNTNMWWRKSLSRFFPI